MAEDYDAPRRDRPEEEAEETELEVIRQAATKSADVLDVDEANFGETLEFPGADLSDEQLEVRVIPKQADEFTCSRCFLVQHHSRLARSKGKQQMCRDCA